MANDHLQERLARVEKFKKLSEASRQKQLETARSETPKPVTAAAIKPETRIVVTAMKDVPDVIEKPPEVRGLTREQLFPNLDSSLPRKK